MIKVKLTNPSRITKKTATNDDVQVGDGNIRMARSIYQRLGSLVLCKKILDDYENDKLPGEFKDFLDAFDDITFNKSFPDEPQRDIEYNWLLLDEYLGNLGSVQEYEYSKDIVNIPAWSSTVKQSEYRVLVDTSDNTYLTTNGGTEVLVSYNNISVNGQRRNS